MTTLDTLTLTLGALGTAISFILWLPQAVATYRSRNDPQALRVLSLPTFALLLTNATVWGIYAALTGALWAGAPGIVNGPLAAWTILLILRARRIERTASPAA